MSDTKNGETIFDKVVFGGYDSSQVDEFVYEARKLIGEYKSENIALKKKLQVLADQVLKLRSGDGAAQPAEHDDAPALYTDNGDLKPAATELAQLDKESSELLAALISSYKRRISILRDELSATETVEKLAAPSEPMPSQEPEVSAAEEPELQTIPEVATEQTTEPEPEPVTEPVSEDIIATINDISATIDAVPGEQAGETPEQSSPVLNVTRIGEEDSTDTPETKPEEEKLNEETKEQGISKELTIEGVDTTNLSYEAELALVLKRNGIPVQQTEEETENTDDLENPQPLFAPRAVSDDTKRYSLSHGAQARQPKPEVRKPETAQRGKKQEKKGFFKSLHQSISAFVQSEDDDETLSANTYNKQKAPRQQIDTRQELQFGKAYDVRKKD